MIPQRPPRQQNLGMDQATPQPGSESRSGWGLPGAPPRVLLPTPRTRPLESVLRRVALASAILAASVVLVYLDRGGYKDSAGGGPLTFIDALYYTTVTLSTTGYGDIVPAAESARLINALVVTPLRVIFLIILVGTTLEVLTERTRQEWRQARWRRQLTDHVVIVGFGTKGRTAATTLLGNGVPAARIVVVDERPEGIAEANALGLAGVCGDGAKTDVLTQAGVAYATTVVVAPPRDDTAVLVTLTVRQLNRTATVVATVREEENAPLVRQSGADTVITSSDAAGQLLGVSTLSPRVGQVVMDLLSHGGGLDIVERPADEQDVGRGPRACREPVLAVVRGSRLLRFDDPEAESISRTDRLIVVRAGARQSSARG
jgi:voltage-gated potassium channel